MPAHPRTAARLQRRLRARYWLALLAVAWAGIEATCLLGLAALEHFRRIEVVAARPFALHARPRERIERIVAGDEEYTTLDPDLGWSPKPGGDNALYRANAAGIRGDAEYLPTPPPRVTRIAAFGDSFVHGNEVHNHETWPAQLAGLRDDLEVLNFGVGGYGIDQAYLRFRRDGVRFHPHIVVIGYMPENLHRSLNSFRPFYATRAREARSKPRFALEGDRLVLVPNPLRSREDYRELLEDEATALARLGGSDFYYQTRHRPRALSFLPSLRLYRTLALARSELRPIVAGRYNPRSEAYRVTLAVLEAFQSAVYDSGAVPLVAILPRRVDLDRELAGRGREYQPLLDDLRQGPGRVVDLLDCLAQARRRGTIEFMDGGHYAPSANARVAGCLLATLVEAGWLDPERRAAELGTR